MSRRIGVAVAVGVTLASAALLGGVANREASSGPPARTGVDPGSLLGAVASPRTGELVVRLQSDVRARPEDPDAAALLGLAYHQRAVQTGDPAYYSKAEAVLSRAQSLRRRNLLAAEGLASLALSRHRFHEALSLARAARALSPTTARTYAALGDALVELGRYDEAFAAFDRLASLKPSLAAYARVAYARELVGDFDGARRAFELALDASIAQPEALAWTHVHLGELLWTHGRIAAAAREARSALAVFPGYAHADDLLALTEAARGRRAAAIRLERRAADAVPLPEFTATLSGLYTAAGRPREARREDEHTVALQRRLRANGVDIDLERALVEADKGEDIPQALALARKAHRARPSIDGDDVLAWALQRSGRCAEALRYSRRSLRLGTEHALKFFHRGMIERCLGRPAAGRLWFRRALELNPSFSLTWAAVARRYAQRA